jgi:hypothetical protein
VVKINHKASKLPDLDEFLGPSASPRRRRLHRRRRAASGDGFGTLASFDDGEYCDE